MANEAPETGVTHLDGFDGDALCEVVRGTSLRHAQLGAGRFSGRLFRLALQTSVVDAGQYNLPVHGQGSFPADRIVLGTLLSNDGPAWVGTDPVERGDLLFCGPGAPLDVILGYDAHWAALGVPVDRLREEAARLEIAVPERIDRVVVSRPALDTFDRLDIVLRDALRLVVSDAAALDEPAVRAGVERTVSRAFLLALEHLGETASRRPRAGGSAVQRRALVARRAEEYIESHPDSPIYVADLCRLTGVSERTLRYVFEGRYGMSPIAYLRARRLCGVRRDLLQSRGSDISVKDVARRWGYWHCGRLAAEYRRQFGESPSETTGRAPRPPA